MKHCIEIFLLSEGWAGAEHVVYNICKNLIHFNKKINLYINTEIAHYYSELEGCTIYNLGSFEKNNRLKQISCLLKINKKLKNLLVKNKSSCLILFLSDAIFISLFLNKKLKLFSTLNGDEIKDYFGENGFFKKFIMKKCFDKSYEIISVSHHQILNLPEKYKRKTVVIPNGVDSKLFKPLKIKPKKNVVLFAGRYIGIKGLRELLNVAKQLPQYEFWFAGQGPLESEIKGKNIKNWGFKNSEELAKLYNQATICVFPSYREGFPLCGLEAMSCGKSVIATPLGFSEYIENGKDGIIIPAKDEKALKEAIVKLMNDEKLREKLGRNARKKALKYSWEKVASQYYDLFEKVINENEKQRQRE